MTEKTLLLVDGSSYLYRAFHAMPDLRGPDGFPTGAIHGVVAMMRLLRKQYPAEHAACVFDAPGPTFRNDLYDDYKATRTAMPDPLVQQIAPIHAVVRLLGWPVLMVPGIEADDVIGTLAEVAARGGHRVMISTGDKDLAQLVNEQVTLINTMSNERLDMAGVQAKFGVPPSAVVDYLTLMGDSVDNVPGVDKVGPKTAARWIAEHGSLEGVMAAASGIKGVAGENLRRALEWLPKGKRLVTVLTDCDLASHVYGWPDLDALALGAEDHAGLVDFYTHYGFKTWLKQELAGTPEAASASASAPAPALAPAFAPEFAPAFAPALAPAFAPAFAPAADEALPPPAAAPVEWHHTTVLDVEALDALMARVVAAPLTAIHLESDSPDGMRAQIVGLSLSVRPFEAAYVPLRHGYPGAADQLPAELVLARLRPWLEDAAAAKLGHNVKHDTHIWANAGITVRGYVHDTMLQSYVLEAHKPHGLSNLALRHLGRSAVEQEALCGKGAGQIPFAQVEIGQASAYSCDNSDMLRQVHDRLWPQVQADAGLLDVYRRIELPTADLLCRIERTGVLIDSALLARQSRDLAERMLALEGEAFALAGQPFNLGSPKQIGEILFGKLGLPVKKKTASGAPSTDEEVLAELAADYPLPARLLEHRSLSKLKGTYTDKLPLMVNPATGRLHTNYAQAVAVTGRLSSNDPNLQNIPIRTAEGRRVREAFIAPPGHFILSADYSQIELRIMAHMSSDPGLLHAFSEGIDVHRATASEVFGVPVPEVSSEQRRFAKVINFGLIYGMGAFGLASNLGIEQKAARDYIERYFTRFAGVKRYMDETKASARANGYVQTLFGRRVYLPEINGGNGPRKAGAERQAINAPMQGSAADLIKLAMLAVQRTLDEQQRSTRIVMQVHDELVFEVPEAELAWARIELPRVMASVAELKVPLLAEVGVGAHWDEAH